MAGIQCYYCGKFIAYKDFDEGKVLWVPEFRSDIWYSLDPPEDHPVCSNCTEKEHEKERQQVQ